MKGSKTKRLKYANIIESKADTDNDLHDIVYRSIAGGIRDMYNVEHSKHLDEQVNDFLEDNLGMSYDDYKKKLPSENKEELNYKSKLYISAIATSKSQGHTVNEALGLLYSEQIPYFKSEKDVAYDNLLKVVEKDMIEKKQYKEFEDLEQEIFLNEHFSMDDLRLLLPNCMNTDLLGIKNLTKRSIKKGIDEYFNEKKSDSLLYDSTVDRFYLGDLIEKNIVEDLGFLKLDSEEVKTFGDYVAQAYRTFLSNKSLDRYSNI